MWALAALAFVALARGLPADTFFVGDPGVKLIAARNAIAHPTTPLDIPLPAIGGVPIPYVEPFFAVHGDHSHAVTSEIFPLLSAPFIAAFGVRGAYVLPAFGFFLALWACARLAVTLDSRRSATGVVLSAALGTPLLFYGLEFWEHAPAVGVAALATVLLLAAPAVTKSSTTEDTEARTTVTENIKGNRAHRAGSFRDLCGGAFVAGLLFGIAALLRPEALCFVAAVACALPLLPAPPRAARLGAAAVGLAAGVSPLLVYSLVHFGTIIPPHVGVHAGLLTTDWFAARATLVSGWFLPSGAGRDAMWGVALLVPLVVSWFLASAPRQGRAFLAATVVIDIALVLLTAPNDGGGQWGPRYLLFAYVPAAILVADAIHAVARRHVAGVMAAVVLVAAGVWAQRAGYRELRGAKITYGRVLDLVRSETQREAAAVTDLWWLDQVAAAADRPILFAANAKDRGDIMRRLHKAGASSVTAFVSRDESPDVEAWSHLACYELAGRVDIQTRNLAALHLRRADNCPP